MKDGFIRVASATPEIKVADCAYNTKKILELVNEAAKNQVSIIVFPELCITGYTCGDLFFQDLLIDQAKKSLNIISSSTKDLDMIIVVGLPLKDGSSLYNCAAVLYHGDVMGFVPKTHLPNYAEFQELRYFSKSCDYKCVTIDGKSIPIGNKIIFVCENIPELKLGVEVCEDLWVTIPQSSYLAASGATVIANISSSSELVGKSKYRTSLVESQSSRIISAYIYADSGSGESSTDLVFSGHNMIAEVGTVLSESKRFTTGIIFADIDLQKIESERRKDNNFNQIETLNKIYFNLPVKDIKLKRKFERLPFVPTEKRNLNEVCEEILNIQSYGLIKRLKYMKCEKIVLGLSGGLDSTLALLVSLQAFNIMNYNKKNIFAVTMPCFGTTEKTKSNVFQLCNAFDVTLLEVPINNSVLQHFEDINHDINNYDITYENAQARERTQVLMDIANQKNALVLGTGDMSELALGWSTYNGDHMSMYGINSSVPKTLIRCLVNYKADMFDGEKKDSLLNVLSTTISPELLPPKDGIISQSTEDVIGSYELHDFFLYYIVRFGFSPQKVYRIAMIAFKDVYESTYIKECLKIFIKRFFKNQFKRSCLPDGPKVGSVCLSPRGDLRVPSDASAVAWLDEI